MISPGSKRRGPRSPSARPGERAETPPRSGERGPRSSSARPGERAEPPPRVILGVTGGIAAYKAAEVVRGLRRAGAEVSVIMTEHAREFITPLTLQTLSGKTVLTGQFDVPTGGDIEHIALVRNSDLLLVAPATADILAKFAGGVADDFLTTFYTAYTGPVLVAPAMNSRMWAHQSVQENLAILRSRGVGVVEPEEGELACGEEGMGRLASEERIVIEALRWARRGTSLAGEKVLVTAGPTREALDPVRFLSNRSSGRMGYAIAAAARRRGAAVNLISGPTSLPPPWGVELARVETAEQMAEQVRRRFEESTICFMTAAVSDYRPSKVSQRKLSRGEGRVLDLVPTEDILASLGRGASREGRLLVGFAAETGNPETAARKKLLDKNLDYIFANDVTRSGAGFDVETNILVGLARDGSWRKFPLASKGELAEQILDWIEERRKKGLAFAVTGSVKARSSREEGGKEEAGGALVARRRSRP